MNDQIKKDIENLKEESAIYKEPIKILVELDNENQAQAFAQFLKRVGFSNYRELAVSDEEAYEMNYAGSAIREALAEKGFNPR